MGTQSEKQLKDKCRECAIVFCICLLVSIGLLLGGFFMPPQGKIDGSVLKAVGELFGFAALAVGAHAIELGYDLKVSNGNTSVEIHNE